MRAKVSAVKAHLAYHYEYNQEELDSLTIIKTKRTNKDDIVYIAVEDVRDIADIYGRKAECRSDDTIVKNYIPPQFFARYSALNKICQQRREEDDSLKTQMRFGDGDLKILTEVEGGEEPFRHLDMNMFLAGDKLPDFDHTLKWRVQSDRPPRRRVGSRDEEPANWHARVRDPAMQNGMRRQHSEKEEEQSKKQRRNDGRSSSPVNLPAIQNADVMM